MRQNKWTILICFPITLAALFGAWTLNNDCTSFWSNVLLGIFGSGLLTFVAAIINYFSERRRILESFWTLGHKAIRSFGRYPTSGNNADKIESILIMAEFDFSAFDDAYGAIDFILGNKKTRRKIFKEIYRPIRDAGASISVSASNIIRLRREIPGNSEILKKYVSQIDDILIAEERTSMESTDGKKVSVTWISNGLTNQCLDHLNNFYWEVMYPLRKQGRPKQRKK